MERANQILLKLDLTTEEIHDLIRYMAEMKKNWENAKELIDKGINAQLMRKI